jgi:hypothetical protein
MGIFYKYSQLHDTYVLWISSHVIQRAELYNRDEKFEQRFLFLYFSTQLLTGVVQSSHNIHEIHNYHNQ